MTRVRFKADVVSNYFMHRRTACVRYASCLPSSDFTRTTAGVTSIRDGVMLIHEVKTLATTWDLRDDKRLRDDACVDLAMNIAAGVMASVVIDVEGLEYEADYESV